VSPKFTPNFQTLVFSLDGTQKLGLALNQSLDRSLQLIGWGSYMATRAVFSCLVLALIGLAACADDEGNRQEVIPTFKIPSPDSGEDMVDASGDTTPGDVDLGESSCQNVDCGPREKCVSGICVPEESLLACENVDDLGIIMAGEIRTAQGSTVGYIDTLRTSCGGMADLSGPENAFAFELDGDALIEVTLNSEAAIDWSIEVREGSCENPTSIVRCSDVEMFRFFARQGVAYGIIVEPRQGIDVGEFSLSLETESATCQPGARVCVGDDLGICQAGTSEETYRCAETCVDDACSGDVCNAPIEVTASTTYIGDAEAHTNQVNFESQASCSAEGSAGYSTPGEDIFFFIPGLTAGQVVTIDASENDTIDHAIAIVSDCSAAPECIAAIDLGDRLEWTVTDPGDYFAVVDKWSSSAKPFQIAIDIQ
jgi:hypothetical protein